VPLINRWLSFALIVFVAPVCGPSAAADDLAPRKQSSSPSTVSPIITKFCLKCHGDEKPKAGVNLAKLVTGTATGTSVWERVLDQLEAQAMPPEGQPKATPAEMEQIGRWAAERLAEARAKIPPSPGKVTIRRLNRVEYNNTIRDLVWVPFRPADDFPSDDVGYGFDNIGDVLSLPPVLMERYMAAAEKIATKAIAADARSATPLKTHLDHEQLSGGDQFGKSFRILTTNGEIGSDVTFPQDGEYFLQARAFGQHAGNEPPMMAFKVDGETARVVPVKAGEKKPVVYSTKVRVRVGQRRVALAFLNDFYDPKNPNPQARDRNLLVEYVEVSGPAGFKPPSLPASHRLILFVTPGPKLDDREAARAIIERFASRAFRRPAQKEEVERYLRLVDLAASHGEGFERRIQIAVQAILVSPHFLFRVELDPWRLSAGESRSLNDYEVASRLSYFLWSSMPDDALFQAAKEGSLRGDAALEAQVSRMLKDPKARALVENFAGQWLQLRNLRTSTPDPALFPSFDLALRSSMRQESELFFEAVLKEDRSILDFLDSDYTFVNARLARHYGISGVHGGFQKVALKDGRRGGVLTQASVLTVTSNPTRTSPVKRGKWVLEQLLGTPPPPPLPDVPKLPDDKEGTTGTTLRQKMESHRRNPSCASCHARMDPIGFGLENYDATGAWRTLDGKFPIDVSGTLPSGQSFRGPDGLKGILVGKRDDFARCLTRKMFTYGLGRGLEAHDTMYVDRIVAALAKDGYKFSRLIVEIVKSEPFRKRAGEAPEGTP
jgi:hypothetical protein